MHPTAHDSMLASLQDMSYVHEITMSALTGQRKHRPSGEEYHEKGGLVIS
jgi:hypothetical protein